MFQCRQRNLPAYGDLTGRRRILDHDRPGNTALGAAAGDIARPTCGQFPATCWVFLSHGAQLSSGGGGRSRRGKMADVISYPVVLVARGSKCKARRWRR
jgi:hypothetical protein